MADPLPLNDLHLVLRDGFPAQNLHGDVPHSLSSLAGVARDRAERSHGMAGSVEDFAPEEGSPTRALLPAGDAPPAGKQSDKHRAGDEPANVGPEGHPGALTAERAQAGKQLEHEPERQEEDGGHGDEA